MVKCESDHPNFIQSLQFQLGEDNSGSGCILFEDRECMGGNIAGSN